MQRQLLDDLYAFENEFTDLPGSMIPICNAFHVIMSAVDTDFLILKYRCSLPVGMGRSLVLTLLAVLALSWCCAGTLQHKDEEVVIDGKSEYRLLLSKHHEIT